MFGNITRIISPCIQFLFVGSHICRQLPSDSTSQWTPLLLANTPYCKACSGLAPYSVITMSGAPKKPRDKSRGSINMAPAGFYPAFWRDSHIVLQYHRPWGAYPPRRIGMGRVKYRRQKHYMEVDFKDQTVALYKHKKAPR